MKNLLKKLFKKNDLIDQKEYDFYKEIDIFKSLSKIEIQKLIELSLTRNFKENEIIFRENYPHIVLYIIKSGQVNLYINASNKKIIISELVAKDHFGKIGVFIDANRITSAVAVENTELIAIKHSDLKHFIKLHPSAGMKLLYNFGKSLSNDLIEMNLKVKDYETKK